MLFVLVLLAGCRKSVKVTEENVKELFTPTLEADAYMYGSAFYSVEKDEKGYPKLYKVTDDFSGYKITEKTTVDEIFEKAAKYEKKNSELTESKKKGFSRKGLDFLCRHTRRANLSADLINSGAVLLQEREPSDKINNKAKGCTEVHP